MGKRWRIFRFVVCFVVTGLMTLGASDLVMSYLASERPYTAVGGEWIFLPMVVYASWKGCSLIFDAIEFASNT